MAHRPGALASLGLESPGAGLGCFLGDIAIFQGLSLDLSPGYHNHLGLAGLRVLFGVCPGTVWDRPPPAGGH